MSEITIFVTTTESHLRDGERSMCEKIGNAILPSLAARFRGRIDLVLYSPKTSDPSTMIKEVTSLILQYEMTHGAYRTMSRSYYIVTLNDSRDAYFRVLYPDVNDIDLVNVGQLNLSRTCAEAQEQVSISFRATPATIDFPTFKAGTLLLTPFFCGMMELEVGDEENGTMVGPAIAMKIATAHQLNVLTAGLGDPGEPAISSEGGEGSLKDYDTTSNAGETQNGNQNTTPDELEVVQEDPEIDNGGLLPTPEEGVQIFYQKMAEVERWASHPDILSHLGDYIPNTEFGGLETPVDMLRSDALREFFDKAGVTVVNRGTPWVYAPNVVFLIRLSFIDLISGPANYLHVPLGNSAVADAYKDYIPAWFEYFINETIINGGAFHQVYKYLVWYHRVSLPFLTKPTVNLNFVPQQLDYLTDNVVIERYIGGNRWVDILEDPPRHGVSNVYLQELTAPIFHLLKTAPYPGSR